MKKLFEKVVQFVIIVVVLFCSKQCATDYVNGSDKKAIANYKKMIADKSYTLAILNPKYEEITVKVLRIPVKMYQFDYHFEINGKSYSGTHTFNQLPKTPFIKVYYSKNNPDFNTTEPQQKLKEELEKGTSNADLYWSIGWGIFGLFMLFGFIVSIKEEIAARKANIQ